MGALGLGLVAVRVPGSGFRVPGSGFRVHQCLGVSRVQGASR